MSFWVAGAVVVGSVGSAVISSRAASKAASAQSSGLDAATQAQMEMNDKSIAATLQGYGMAADATRYGADQAAQSAQDAIDAQMDMYNQTRQDQMPWMVAGKKALGTLEGMVNAGPGEFTESPGYQFRLDQGNQNILNAASATGGIDSGRTLKALTEYGQDYASNEYGNFLNQYYASLAPFQALSGVGMNGAQSVGSAGVQTGAGVAGTYNALGQSQQLAAGQLASNYAAGGAAQASGYTDAGNAIANNAMGQANISATKSINQGNAWTNALSQGLSIYGMVAGNTPAGQSGPVHSPWLDGAF